jgi:hypothetical protein
MVEVCEAFLGRGDGMHKLAHSKGAALGVR